MLSTLAVVLLLLAHEAAHVVGFSPSLLPASSFLRRVNRGSGGRGSSSSGMRMQLVVEDPNRLLFPEAIVEDEDEHLTTLTRDQPTFASFSQISGKTSDVLARKNIVNMTPIQAQTFTPIYDGSDMIGRSRTGTGKTVAFGLPLLERLRTDKESIPEVQRDRDPKILVLEPTRELAKQVEVEIGDVARVHRMGITCIHGGVPFGPQENALRKGVDIVVGTPGRLLDLIQSGHLRLDSLRHVVLDEADEMLNMGFAEDIERIFGSFDVRSCQVLMFSATTPRWVKDMSRQYLKNPLDVDVVGKSTQRTATSVRHIAVQVPERIEDKAAVLEDIVAVESRGGQTIVFTQTKREADELASEGAFKAFSAAVLHGDIGQQTRDHTMQRFRKGLFKVLVATDVAARGIDVGNVDLVVQCSPPKDPDAYVHRSGRTGRAGREGTCVLLYSDREKWELSKLESSCGVKFDIKPPPSTQLVMESSASAVARQLDTVEGPVIPFFLETARDVLKRSDGVGMGQEELLARCLAVMAKKQELVERSLLNGMPDHTTMQFTNQKRGWRDARDVLYWIHRVSEDLRVTLGRLGKIRISQDMKHAVFDVHSDTAKMLVSLMTKYQEQGVPEDITDPNIFDDFSLAAIHSLPPLQEETVNDFTRGSRYGDRRGGPGGEGRFGPRRGGRAGGYGSQGGSGSRFRSGGFDRDNEFGGAGRRERTFEGGRGGGRRFSSNSYSGGSYSGGSSSSFDDRPSKSNGFDQGSESFAELYRQFQTSGAR